MHPRRLRLACLLLAWACTWSAPAYAEDLWPDLAKPPAAQGGGERDAALIVGIEDYDKVADVPGAERNAKAWYLYLTQTRKLPVESVRLLKNDEATLDALQREAQTARQRVKPGGTLWVIFIGHGAPSKDGQDGLLVGADARQNPDSIYERSLRVGWRPALGDERQSLLDLLQGGPQEHTTLILDTCFSGQTQEDQPLVAGLQPLIPVHAQTAPAPALTVFTATSRQEFAGPLPGLSLPAFSYLLLGALRGWGDEDRDGQVTHAEALAYTRRTLSAVLKGRSQTPELRSADPDRVVSRPRDAERAPDLAKVVLHDAPSSDPGKANRDAAPATPAHAVNASTNPPNKVERPTPSTAEGLNVATTERPNPSKPSALPKRPKAAEPWTPNNPGLEIVEFSSKPPGAAVALDSKPLCVSTPCARELPHGTYAVSMSDPCHEPNEAPVQVRAGRAARVSWTLKPKPAGLEVRAYDPQGNALKAKVYVDGAEVGQTPGTFTVSACAQRVEVRAAGYLPFQASLSLRARDTSRVQAHLAPPPNEDLAEPALAADLIALDPERPTPRASSPAPDALGATENGESWAFEAAPSEPAEQAMPQPARIHHAYTIGQTLIVGGEEWSLLRVHEITITGKAPALLLELGFEDELSGRSSLALALYTSDMNNPALLGLCGLGGIFDLDRDGISDLYLTCSELMFASSSVVSLNEDNPRVFFEVDHYEETRGNEDGALNKSYTFYDISLSFQDLNGDGKLDIIETKASVDGDASEKTTRQHITE